MRGGKFFTFMLIPHQGKRPYSFRVHNASFCLLIGLIGIGLIGSVLYFLGTQERAGLKGKLKALQTTNVAQDKQIQEMNRHLDELKAFGRKVKTLTGISGEDSIIQDIGGQGGALLYFPGEEFYFPEDKSFSQQIKRNLEELKKEIYLEKQTFRELIKHLDEKNELFAYTPSICPVNGAYISSVFGWRRDPFSKKRRFHYGLDLVARRGTAVRVTAAGRVVFVGWQGGLGNKIMVKHGHNFKTVYAHLDRIKVRWGEFVKKGQIIGTLGNTGRSTGPHLHYEVHRKGERVNPVKYILVKLK